MARKKNRNRHATRHLWPLGLAVVPLAPAPAGAAEIVVNSTAQEATHANINGIVNGNCTLGEAILSANAGLSKGGCVVVGSGLPYTIVLQSGETYTLTAQHNALFGFNGLPAVTSEILIDGDGATIERSSGDDVPFRLFAVEEGAKLTLRDLTLQNGLARGGDGGGTGGGGGAGLGGALYNRGTLTLTGTTLTKNTAQGGGVGSGPGGGGGGFGGNGGEGVEGGGGGGGGDQIDGHGGFGSTDQGGAGGRFNGGRGGDSSNTAEAGGFGGGGGGDQIDGHGGFGSTDQGGAGGRFNGGRGGDSSNTAEAGGFGGGGGGRGFGEGGRGGFGGGGGAAGGDGGFGGGGAGAGLGGNGGFGGGGGVGGEGGFGGGHGGSEFAGGGAGMGGVIFNDGGTLTVVNATLSANAATGGTGGDDVDPGQGLGGGIFARNGTVSVHSATLNNNTAAQGGGALYLLGDDGTVTYSVTNTILANTPGGASDAFVSGSAVQGTPANTHNLVEVNGSNPGGSDANDLAGVTQTGDPMLGGLADNGGPTKTHALCTAAGVPDTACTGASPAIEAGDNAAVGTLTTDQRGTGFDRISDAECNNDPVVDIGAYEEQRVCNRPPVAKCTDRTVAAGPSCTAEASIDNGSSDLDTGDTITLAQDPAGPYALGATTVTLTVTDDDGLSDSCNATVTVEDSTAPVLTLTTQPITLWPPNHSYRTVTVGPMVQGVSDNCAALSANDVKIASVTSDEPENAAGNSDGNTTADIVIAQDCKSVQLRAERDGNKNGRVYSIALEVSDEGDNTATATRKVTVPKSQGSGGGAVEGPGPGYTVTSSCP